MVGQPLRHGDGLADFNAGGQHVGPAACTADNACGSRDGRAQRCDLPLQAHILAAQRHAPDQPQLEGSI